MPLHTAPSVPRRVLAGAAILQGYASHAAHVLQRYDEARRNGIHVRIERDAGGFSLRDSSGSIIFD